MELPQKFRATHYLFHCYWTRRGRVILELWNNQTVYTSYSIDYIAVNT